MRSAVDRTHFRRAAATSLGIAALAAAAWMLAVITADDRAAGGRLAGSAAGAPWPRAALDRDAHARRYAARLGLIDGQGGVLPELLDREAWTAIDAEVVQAEAADRLRRRLRWQGPGVVAAIGAALSVAAALAWHARRAPAWLAAAGLLAVGAIAVAARADRLDVVAGALSAWR